MNELTNINLLEEHSEFLGLGNKATKDLKKQFEKRYKTAWRAYWQNYKNNGGNKDRLSISWDVIDKYEVQQKSQAYRILVNLANPASIMIRNGFYVALKINFFGMAARLYPAYLSEADLKKGNYNAANAKRAKTVLTKVELTVVRRLGGTKKALEKAVKEGAKKQARKLDYIKDEGKYKSSFAEDYSNSTEPFSWGVAITAALGLITSVITMLDDGGASDNPYNSGTDASIYTGSKATGIDPKKAMQDLENMPNAFPAWGYVAIGAGLLIIIGVGMYFLLRKPNVKTIANAKIQNPKI